MIIKNENSYMDGDGRVSVADPDKVKMEEKKREKEKEMDPEQLRRLEEIKGRDLEKLSKEKMNRCHHVQFKIGPMHFYFNPVTSFASAVIIWIFVGLCVGYPTC